MEDEVIGIRRDEEDKRGRKGCRGRTLSVTGDDDTTSCYKDTKVEVFTVLDIVQEEDSRLPSEKKAGSKGGPVLLSRSALRWVYFNIWLEYYGFRVLISLLLSVALTAAVAGFIYGFDRTEVGRGRTR